MLHAYMNTYTHTYTYRRTRPVAAHLPKLYRIYMPYMYTERKKERATYSLLKQTARTQYVYACINTFIDRPNSVDRLSIATPHTCMNKTAFTYTYHSALPLHGGSRTRNPVRSLTAELELVSLVVFRGGGKCKATYCGLHVSCLQ